ncbi:GntR family transcriptional regulator [Nocardiopsis valliformis]|uniref:GntR family transcriptional regulator n=1 Tax=Nocardiopsis valliformis TaxID=239974 RepID=UPI000368E39C|nr:GntR family transcriptional regulator [Nocardiopsis valliformis]
MTSRYREIAEEIRERISSGTYARGKRLPPQSTLADEFGVSQPVVQRAVMALRTEGLVRIERGTGTVVHEIKPIVRNATARYTKTAREQGQSRGAFATEVRSLGHNPQSELVQLGPTNPPQEIAEIFQFGRDDIAAIRHRHMKADDTPVQIATSYVPWAIAKDTPITQEDTGPGGTYSRLEDLGHRVVRFTERIRTRPPSEEEAAFLRLGDDQQVYSVLHIAYTEDDKPVEVTQHVMPTFQWVLEYEWAAD